MAKSPKHPASEHHHQAAAYHHAAAHHHHQAAHHHDLGEHQTRRSTPTRLTNIASRETSTPRPLANILINDGPEGGGGVVSFCSC
jgi:hypothetical protein